MQTLLVYADKDDILLRLSDIVHWLNSRCGLRVRACRLIATSSEHTLDVEAGRLQSADDQQAVTAPTQFAAYSIGLQSSSSYTVAALQPIQRQHTTRRSVPPANRHLTSTSSNNRHGTNPPHRLRP